MRETDNRSPTLVDLMKDIVAEKLDDVPVASFAPSRVPREPAKVRGLGARGNIRQQPRRTLAAH
jgi:hypothetical protein